MKIKLAIFLIIASLYLLYRDIVNLRISSSFEYKLVISSSPMRIGYGVISVIFEILFIISGVIIIIKNKNRAIK